MAQFGKHLFGTSYFGKTSTFDGQYETEVIDSGTPFEGRVRVALEAVRPSVTYNGADSELAFQANRWTHSGTQAQTSQSGSTVKLLACGSRFTINAQGQGIIRFENVETQEVQSHAFTNIISLEKPFKDYLVTVETGSGNFTFQSLVVRVSAVGVEVRAARTLADPLNFIPQWESYHSLTMTVNPSTGQLEGETPVLSDKRYIQVKLHLSTSDGSVAPTVDALHFSSGDLSEHAPNGQWYCSLNLRNVARGVGRTFRRAKRVRWKEKENDTSQLIVRSTSVSGSSTGHPSRTQILDNSYWKAETAPYVLMHDAQAFGVPLARISLAERENGFADSSNRSSVMVGPMNPRNANLSNTSLVRWLDWNDRAYFPTNTQGVSVVYEVFKNRDDIDQGYAPIFSVRRGQTVRDRLITLAKEDQTESIWIRVQLERTAGRQSPVVDMLDVRAQMHYESPRATARYTDALSPLDGATADRSERGRKNLRTVASSIFDWPSLTQALQENTESLLDNDRKVRMDYVPKYVNQVQIGLGSNLSEQASFKANQPISWTVWSQTDADTPTASTRGVDGRRLVWHASYDGGTVNYPISTERDLTTDFTPRLLEEKRYRFYIQNGWGDETFTLPLSMSWSQIEDITGHRKEAIETVSGPVRLYNGRVPMGYTLTLPNTSKNDKINLQFKRSQDSVTEKSVWNKEDNDTVEAWIPDGGDYQYIDWVSDEMLFDGMLNANDTLLPYVRTQSSVMNARGDSTYIVDGESETAHAIAQRFAVNASDLKLRNNNKEEFQQGESVLIPGTFSLPSLAPGLIYDGSNPYMIEIVPGSVRKLFGNIRLPENIITPGSDDEDAIQYSLVDSPAKVGQMTRGSIRNGRDLIPFSDTRQVLRVVDENGIVYTPYVQSGSSHMGDYKVTENRIDWSPTHSGSKEPDAGVSYSVTVIHGIVNTMRLVYSSDYSERMAVDRLWRSRESVEIDGIVTPQEDFLADLPEKNSFQGWSNRIKDAQYVVEDNDLWVHTSIVEHEGKEKLFATLNGEDPARNWYPTIQTGFYYLNDQEYYLYSEPRKQVFEEKDVPIIENVTYSTDGLQLGTD